MAWPRDRAEARRPGRGRAGYKGTDRPVVVLHPGTHARRRADTRLPPSLAKARVTWRGQRTRKHYTLKPAPTVTGDPLHIDRTWTKYDLSYWTSLPTLQPPRSPRPNCSAKVTENYVIECFTAAVTFHARPFLSKSRGGATPRYQPREIAARTPSASEPSTARASERRLFSTTHAVGRRP